MMSLKLIFVFLIILICTLLYLKSIETFNNKNKIALFYHICELGNWKQIVDEQLNLIKSTGLYDKAESINIGFLGDKNNIIPYLDNKIKLVYHSNNKKEYEMPTINKLNEFCKNAKDEYYVLYLHSKGTSRDNNINVLNWRRMMEYYLIENYKKCISFLKSYDTIGCNICLQSKPYECPIDKEKHSHHYSGNFWWANSKYIKKLKYIKLKKCKNYPHREWRNESWILYYYPLMKALEIKATPETHLYNKSYDRDFYKKKKGIKRINQ